jgi:hypothetical protein
MEPREAGGWEKARTTFVVGGVVLVLILVALAVVGAFQEPSAPTPAWLRNVQVGADIFQKLATPLAIVVGGLFAYYKLVVERTHASRIQPAIDYEVGQQDDRIFLKASVSGTNIGNSKVSVASEYCGVRFYTRRAFDDGWWLMQAERVFEAQEWFEPGETLGESVWFELYKADWVVIKIDLYIARSEDAGWYASNLVSLVSLDDNQNKGTRAQALEDARSAGPIAWLRERLRVG